MNYFLFAHRTTSNFDESVQEEGENTGGEDSSHELVLDNEIIPPQSDRYSTPKSKKQNNSKVQKMTPFQKEFLSNLATTEEDVTSDPDKAFLYSLLPDYKRLNYDQKTDFRIMALQYFRNVSLGSNQLQSTPPYFNINQNTSQNVPIPNQYSNVCPSFNPGLGNNQNYNLMPQPLPIYSSNFNPNAQHSTPYSKSAYNYISDQSQQPTTSGDLFEKL